jgi:hypothetical protein
MTALPPLLLRRWPATHVHWGESSVGDATAPIQLLARAGEAVLFDYRLKHRGLANRSSDPRPLM